MVVPQNQFMGVFSFGNSVVISEIVEQGKKNCRERI
jgi:hypothetical protein